MTHTTFRLKAKSRSPQRSTALRAASGLSGFYMVRESIYASARNSLGATHPLQRQAHSPYVKQTARRATELSQWRGEPLLAAKQAHRATCVNARLRLRFTGTNSLVGPSRDEGENGGRLLKREIRAASSRNKVTMQIQARASRGVKSRRVGGGSNFHETFPRMNEGRRVERLRVLAESLPIVDTFIFVASPPRFSIVFPSDTVLRVLLLLIDRRLLASACTQRFSRRNSWPRYPTVLHLVLVI
ncbi:hypothetical protein ALC62_06484 [Cyphomyrmex costatus]|uniref:Uncharacterized protein n=1 Tax=Cyphomyrmex costatus TaxID=456900 RepID=A0A195CRE8_9HYME|nr:hypothetical protein ALC62_06484 [Cyphomyrmex costatus]